MTVWSGLLEETVFTDELDTAAAGLGAAGLGAGTLLRVDVTFFVSLGGFFLFITAYTKEKQP